MDVDDDLYDDEYRPAGQSGDNADDNSGAAVTTAETPESRTNRQQQQEREEEEDSSMTKIPWEAAEAAAHAAEWPKEWPGKVQYQLGHGIDRNQSRSGGRDEREDVNVIHQRIVLL
mmetsp:Transcript_23942/g.27700  ORF Transcript_23942/g.27700 Transcript_23942/m.27700 type:complete len:116 (-) Transcript_23942:880-1227(-)